MMDRFIIDFVRLTVSAQDRLNFRSKKELMSLMAIEKRLLSQMVTRQEKFSRPGIPNRECEHPPQLTKAPLTKIFVKMNDDFGVGIGAECMPTNL